MLQQHAGVFTEGMKSRISGFFLACGPSTPVLLALERSDLFHQHNRSSIEGRWTRQPVRSTDEFFRVQPCQCHWSLLSQPCRSSTRHNAPPGVVDATGGPKSNKVASVSRRSSAVGCLWSCAHASHGRSDRRLSFEMIWARQVA